MDLASFIRPVPDFPQPGILFQDISPLLASPEALRSATAALARDARACGANVIVGIESRGFLFGVAVAQELGLPFVPVRKPGKLPAATMSVEYSLEYGSGRLDIHRDALAPGSRVYIVDDLLATGGTLHACAGLMDQLQARIVGISVLIELTALRGRERIAAHGEAHAVLKY